MNPKDSSGSGQRVMKNKIEEMPEFAHHALCVKVFSNQTNDQHHVFFVAAGRSEWWMANFWSSLSRTPHVREIGATDPCAHGLRHPGGRIPPNSTVIRMQVPLKRRTLLGGTMVFASDLEGL